MTKDEEKSIEKILENSIEVKTPDVVAPHEVDVAAEEEKSIDYTD
jgi:hypothetical protein